MTRIPDAVWRPGPSWKRGYNGVLWNSLGWKEGEVKHSSEGPLSATFGVLDSDAGGSWHFTLPKHGPVRYYQHYELEDVCWHCGLPGDLRHDTSLIGNITLIGEEHEGLYNDPWTAWQLHNSVRLSVAIRAHCIGMRLRELAWRGSLWRHRYLSQTSCDSFRAPEDLPQLIRVAEMPPIIEEDDMTPEECRAAVRAELQVFNESPDMVKVRTVARWLMDKDPDNLSSPNRITSGFSKLEALIDSIRDEAGAPSTVKELVAEALEEQT